MQTKRYKKVLVTEEFLNHWFRDSWDNPRTITQEKGLPSDAELVRIVAESEGMYGFIFRSQEFDVVDEAESIPEIEVQFSKTEVMRND